MIRLLFVLIFVLIACARPYEFAAQQSDEVAANSPTGLNICTDSWHQHVEKATASQDDQGHGPDIASEEWKSVIEFRLGVRDSSDVPPRSSEAWCHYINQLMRARHTEVPTQATSQAITPSHSAPSYLCNGVIAGSIEEMICRDSQLSSLDNNLNNVYQQALIKAANEHPFTLKAEQRGWIKGRDECWQNEDVRTCVQVQYQRRIAALQARYRLISYAEQVYYFCEGKRSNEVVVTFFNTQPATIIAERGDSVSLMYQQPSANGTRYVGRNESFLRYQNKAEVTWGYKVLALLCEEAPASKKRVDTNTSTH